jgi:hypothetical protein
MSFDNLVARCAYDEGATGVDGGEKCVAVLETGLEVVEGSVEFIEEPC